MNGRAPDRPQREMAGKNEHKSGIDEQACLDDDHRSCRTAYNPDRLLMSGTAPAGKLSLYVLQPCLIIMSFQIELTPERLQGFRPGCGLCRPGSRGFIIVTEVLERIGLIDVVEELTIIYTNCGNLILPIVSMTLGPEMTLRQRLSDLF